jgi:hypothetical protein
MRVDCRRDIPGPRARVGNDDDFPAWVGHSDLEATVGTGDLAAAVGHGDRAEIS